MKTKTKLFLSLALLLTSAFCIAQVEPFTRTYRLSPEQTGEQFQAIKKTSDEGYIAAFNQNQGFIQRTSILKLDKYGDVEWHRILDEEEFPDAISYSVCRDYDDNYYLAGYFLKSYYPTLWVDQNGFIAKYNQYGDEIWAKTYGTIPYHETDSSFNSESIFDLMLYDDNRLIVTGSENYCPNNEIQFYGRPWAFAIDTSGNVLWQWNDCNDTIHMFGKFLAIEKLKNGNIVCVGEQIRRRVETNYDSPLDNLGFIAIFDENGNLISRKSWRFFKNVSAFYDVKSLNNNNFAIVAYVADTSANEVDKHRRLSVIVFDNDINEKYQYNVNVGGSGGYSKLSVDKDTNIFIVAATNPSYLIPETDKGFDMVLLKFNKEAELIWKHFVGADSIQFATSSLDVVADNDGGASFCSLCYPTNKNYNGSYLFKVDSLGNGIYPISDFPYPDDDEYIIYNQNLIETIDGVSIYPNPASNEFIIDIPSKLINSSFMMISITGQMVANKNLTKTQETIKITDFKNGIYIIKIQKDNMIALKKIVINK
jgi:hypothetical protein